MAIHRNESSRRSTGEERQLSSDVIGCSIQDLLATANLTANLRIEVFCWTSQRVWPMLTQALTRCSNVAMWVSVSAPCGKAPPRPLTACPDCDVPSVYRKLFFRRFHHPPLILLFSLLPVLSLRRATYPATAGRAHSCLICQSRTQPDRHQSLTPRSSAKRWLRHLFSSVSLCQRLACQCPPSRSHFMSRTIDSRTGLEGAERHTQRAGGGRLNMPPSWRGH